MKSDKENRDPSKITFKIKTRRRQRSIRKVVVTNLARSLGIGEQEGSSKLRVERPDDVIENLSHVGIV